VKESKNAIQLIHLSQKVPVQTANCCDPFVLPLAGPGQLRDAQVCCMRLRKTDTHLTIGLIFEAATVQIWVFPAIL